jgi:hypothetical protein
MPLHRASTVPLRSRSGTTSGESLNRGTSVVAVLVPVRVPGAPRSRSASGIPLPGTGTSRSTLPSSRLSRMRSRFGSRFAPTDQSWLRCRSRRLTHPRLPAMRRGEASSADTTANSPNGARGTSPSPHRQHQSSRATRSPSHRPIRHATSPLEARIRRAHLQVPLREPAGTRPGSRCVTTASVSRKLAWKIWRAARPSASDSGSSRSRYAHHRTHRTTPTAH